ncbi:MarR family winged helix-turn-helix transcriptional regulator [Microvirga rosea]|uniref:MarR family winged helix-turn-helix transcriptional regulator n=1 Tax=Microvirga rosea TaxID=2715425 RepID=UPI001D0BBDF9|nr:MarR family transcriptional regulator [Microvirga rosea]MCB8819503.1 MarR family transcriptional regulator [Microvirga rosea]
MTFDKDTSAGYVVNHMARLFAEALTQRIQPLGLTTGQFPLLLQLWAEEGLTQKQLVERLDVEQATIANTLNRMERDGLVLRKPHPVDGRSQCIHLTRKARALQGPATEAAQSVNDIALRSLSVPDRQAFFETMTEVIKSLQEDLKPLDRS